MKPSKLKVSQSSKRPLPLGKEHQKEEREQYYKFYLDSAQRAIEMMRKQHKSASLMRVNEDGMDEEPQVMADNQQMYQTYNHQQTSGGSPVSKENL